MIRLLGRDVELALTLSQLEPNRLVTYTSVQHGLPDAATSATSHAADGFDYRSSSSTSRDPRPVRPADRPPRRRRAMRRTIENLERELPDRL